MARLDAAAPLPHQPLEIETLLEEVAARGKGLGGRRFHVDAPCDLWVLGDLDQLVQAFLNLASNAVAHPRDGGEVRLVASADERTVRIDVEDDGVGIRNQDMRCIFDRFYRPQDPRAGAGGGSGLTVELPRTKKPA